MQCEREDARFMGVSLMALLVSPRNSCKTDRYQPLPKSTGRACLHAEVLESLSIKTTCLSAAGTLMHDKHATFKAM